MRHVIISSSSIIGAALLASALAAQAAPRTAAHHATYRQAASGCLADQRRIADVIDGNPFMGPQMRKLASQMRARCLPNQSAPNAPLDLGGPTPDPSPPSTGPDTAGMNTPTNPTWPGFDQ
jgi:hypothetical protein